MISEVFNIDCNEYMATLPDKFFDLAICDPPYAVGASDGIFGRRSGSRADGYAETPLRTDFKPYTNGNQTPNEEYFRELFRISKNQIIWGANYYPQYLYHSGAIIWLKHTTGPLSQAEIAFQSFNKLVKIFDHAWSGFVKAAGSFVNNEKQQTIHPNQKPVALYFWLLKNYAKPGDKIFDSHMGSQSSRIACYKMGFNFWGCELDKEYFDAGCKRYENEIKQQRMF